MPDSPDASEPPSWSFLVDENLSRSLVEALRQAGHQAEHARDVGLRSQPDAAVWAYAQAHGQTIITRDEGFADPRQYAPPHAGIIISSTPDRITVDMRTGIILAGLASLAGQSLGDLVFVFEPRRVRIRQ